MTQPTDYSDSCSGGESGGSESRPAPRVPPVIICGNTCGHNHEGVNSPTGCCEEHGPYMYFCYECHEAWKAKHNG